jgi:polar amino acid transport system substrate-binding protein
MVKPTTRREEGNVRRLVYGIIAISLSVISMVSSASADSVLSTVLGRGSVRIAIVTGNAPWVFVDANGELQGYDVEISKLLAKALGVTIDFVRTDTAGRVAQLQTHKADVTIATFTPTLDRMKTISFTDAYVIDGLQVMVSGKRSDLNSIRDFKQGAKIGLARGSTAAQALAKYIPQATVVEFPSTADLAQAIESGQVDGTASNNGLVTATIEQGGGKFKALPELMGLEDDAIGLPQGDFVWWQWLNQFVHQINTDGSNYELYVKWFKHEPPSFVKKAAE